MAEKNPFTTLGFVPSVFNGLTDEQILSLVKSQYRALSAIHHPDKGGKPECFKEVQDAMDKIDEDSEFQYWKNRFLRTRKDRLVELEKANHRLDTEASEVQQSLIAFWQAFCTGRALFYDDWSFLLGKSTKKKYIAGFSVFNPPPVSIIMIDSFEVLMNIVAAKKRDTWLQADPGEHFELRISPEGVMTRQLLVKVHFDPQCDPMPKVRKELIELRDAPTSRSYYWKAEGEPVALVGTLLGSLPKEYLTEKKMREQDRQIAGLIPTDVRASDFKHVNYGYTLNEFEKFLRFIQPRVVNSAFVVSAEKESDNELRYKILGCVRKILPLKAGQPATAEVK